MEAEIIENNLKNTHNQLLNNNNNKNSNNLASAVAAKLVQNSTKNRFTNIYSRTPSQITIKSILTPQTVREISDAYSPLNNHISLSTLNTLKDTSTSPINTINNNNNNNYNYNYNNNNDNDNDYDNDNLSIQLLKMPLNNKPSYEYNSDLFLNTIMTDNDDLNIYKRYYPTITTNIPNFSRYLDLNDDTLVLDRLKAKLDQRDFDMQKRVKDGKEINVLIDITTDGKTVRHQVKSRNSQNLNTNNNNNNNNLNDISLLNKRSRNDNLEDNLTDINPKGYAVKKRLTHNSLPNLITRNNGNKSRKSDEILEINEHDQLKLQTPRNQLLRERERESIHDHLYSLSNRKDNIGYFETYKENQRRKTEFKNRKYTIEDYKHFTSNFGLGKDLFDLRDVAEVQKQERAKKRNDYAEYVQNRNSQMLNQMNPKDSLKAFIQSKNPVLRNTLLPHDNQRVKVFFSQK
jgi:hypothetical protein